MEDKYVDMLNGKDLRAALPEDMRGLTFKQLSNKAYIRALLIKDVQIRRGDRKPDADGFIRRNSEVSSDTFITDVYFPVDLLLDRIESESVTITIICYKDDSVQRFELSITISKTDKGEILLRCDNVNNGSDCLCSGFKIGYRR